MSCPCVIGYEFRAPTLCNGETAHPEIHVHGQPIHAMALVQKDSLHIYGRVCPDIDTIPPATFSSPRLPKILNADPRAYTLYLHHNTFKPAETLSSIAMSPTAMMSAITARGLFSSGSSNHTCPIPIIKQPSTLEILQIENKKTRLTSHRDPANFWKSNVPHLRYVHLRCYRHCHIELSRLSHLQARNSLLDT